MSAEQGAASGTGGGVDATATTTATATATATTTATDTAADTATADTAMADTATSPQDIDSIAAAAPTLEAFLRLPPERQKVVLQARLAKLYASVGVQVGAAKLAGLSEKYGSNVCELTRQLFKKYRQPLFPLFDLAWEFHQKVMRTKEWNREFYLEFEELFAYPKDDRDHGEGRSMHQSNRTSKNNAREHAQARAAATAAQAASPRSPAASSGSKSFLGSLFSGVTKFAIAGFQIATNETAGRRAKFHKVMQQLVSGTTDVQARSHHARAPQPSSTALPELARLATPAPADGWRIIFVRHGEGYHNTGSSTGCLASRDASLTSLGVEEALTAGAALRAVHIDRVLVSPLSRTLETATLVLHGRTTRRVRQPSDSCGRSMLVVPLEWCNSVFLFFFCVCPPSDRLSLPFSLLRAAV